jgi:hypothetical protein
MLAGVGAKRFGVRQLAAAFLRRKLASGSTSSKLEAQKRSRKAGPHSKARLGSRAQGQHFGVRVAKIDQRVVDYGQAARIVANRITNQSLSFERDNGYTGFGKEDALPCNEIWGGACI